MNFFRDIYAEGDVPWETGRPQPEIAALAAAGQISGVVLDAGCGTGENSILMAGGGGCRVVGLDIVPAAIDIARSRAVSRGADVEFLVGDVRDLPFADGTFDTVVDSGLFHVFGSNGMAAYARRLRAAVSAGGLAHLVVWSEEQPGTDGPNRVTRDQLKGYFADGWEYGEIRAGIYETVVHAPGARAWVASFRRSPV